MTTSRQTTTSPHTSTGPHTTTAARLPSPAPYELTFARVVHAEWIKFWSLRSLRRALAAAALCIVGVGVGAAALVVAVADGGDPTDPSAGGLGVFVALSGVSVATLVVAAVGAMVIGGEYATGAIRTTFAVAPRRRTVHAAKATVLGAVVTVVCGSAVLLAFGAGQVLLSEVGHAASVADDGVLRVVLAHVAVLTGTALVAFSLGTLLRSTPGALGATVALLFVVPLVLAPLPDFPGSEVIEDHHFAATTNALTSVSDTPAALSGAAFVLWVAGFLVVSALVLQRRDV